MQNIKTKQKLIQNNKKQNRFSATAFRHWLSFSNKAESSICRSGKTLYVDDPNEKSVLLFWTIPTENVLGATDDRNCRRRC
jgi:hypothetical protein